MNRSLARIPALLLVLLFAFVGCKKSDSGAGATPAAKKPRIAYVCNGVADFWSIAKVGAEKAGSDFSANVSVHMPTEGISDQKRIVEDLITRGVDGIAISPIDPVNQTDLLNKVGDVCLLADQTQESAVSVLADLFHMNIEETDIPQALLACGTRLGHVHLADSNRQAAGRGHTPMEPIFRTLKAMGYQGYVSAEVFPKPDSDTAALATLLAWRNHA